MIKASTRPMGWYKFKQHAEGGFGVDSKLTAMVAHRGLMVSIHWDNRFHSHLSVGEDHYVDHPWVDEFRSLLWENFNTVLSACTFVICPPLNSHWEEHGKMIRHWRQIFGQNEGPSLIEHDIVFYGLNGPQIGADFNMAWRHHDVSVKVLDDLYAEYGRDPGDTMGLYICHKSVHRAFERWYWRPFRWRVVARVSHHDRANEAIRIRWTDEQGRDFVGSVEYSKQRWLLEELAQNPNLLLHRQITISHSGFKHEPFGQILAPKVEELCSNPNVARYPNALMF